MFKRIALLATGVASVFALSACGGTSVSSTPTATLATGTGTAIAATGTTSIPVDSTYALTFSLAMNTSTISTSTITLTCDSTSESIAVASTSTTVFTVTPSASLPASTACTLTIGTGATTRQGTPFPSASTFTFTTESDATTPSISSVTGTTLSASAATSAATIATSGTTGVSGAASSQGALTVTFSEAMEGSTVSNATLTCPSGTSETVTVSPSTNTTAYTITPSAALPQLTDCVLTLPATITSAEGVALTATTYTYTTGCSTNDDFGSITSSTLSTCWTLISTGGSNPTVSSGGLVAAIVGTGTSLIPPSVPSAAKTFGTLAALSGTLQVTAKVSGTTSTFPMPSTDGCLLELAASGSEATGFVIGAVGDDASSVNIATVFGGTLPSSVGPISFSGTPQGAYYCLSLTPAGVVKGGVSATSTCTASTTITGTFPAGTIKALLTPVSGSTRTQTCTFDDFVVTTVTATGPRYEY